MLKQNELTLNPSATSHRGFFESVKTLLNSKNNITSDLTGIDVTHREIIYFVFGSIFLATSLLLLTDSVALYGWSAFSLLAGLMLQWPLAKKLFDSIDNED